MTYGSIAGRHSAKRIAIALLASSCLMAGSPTLATVSAATGANKSVSAGFGDCKNSNAGSHNGYVCPSSTPSLSGSSGGTLIS